MRKLFLFLSLVLLGISTKSQDIHFSQFYVSPFNLNPGDIGQFDGDIRAIGQYRNQWRSVTVPYTTFAIAADSPTLLGIANTSAGLSLYRDQAGDSRFTTTHALVGGSYAIDFPSAPDQQLRIGALLGISHMGLDFSALNYDSQFNGGLFNPNIDPNENYARNARTWFSSHLGATYHWKETKGKSYTAGIAGYNLTGPRQSLFDELGVKLDRRIQLHAGAEIEINEVWDILPITALRFQGPHREWLIGARGRYTLMQVGDEYRALYAGAYARTRDAGYIVAGLDYNQWQFGLSYDINLSDLRTASNGRGGIELSLVYIFKRFNPGVVPSRRICPDYL